jgi:hypothetical protein
VSACRSLSHFCVYFQVRSLRYLESLTPDCEVLEQIGCLSHSEVSVSELCGCLCPYYEVCEQFAALGSRCKVFYQFEHPHRSVRSVNLILECLASAFY